MTKLLPQHRDVYLWRELMHWLRAGERVSREVGRVGAPASRIVEHV